MFIYDVNLGEPIIFIHGLTGTHRGFKHCYHSSFPYRCISYDLMGHGENKQLKDLFTINILTEQLLDVFKKKGIEKAHLCTLSYGSYIGNHFAYVYPEKVLSLCHVGGHYKKEGPLFDIFKTFYQDPREYKEWLKEYSNAIFPKTKKVFDQYAFISRQTYYHLGLHLDPSIIQKSIKHRLFFDIKKEIEDIQKPMLWVMGEFDFLYKDCLTDLQEISPTSIYKEIPKAGHAANLFHPHIFETIYLDFLNHVKKEDLDFKQSKDIHYNEPVG